MEKRAIFFHRFLPYWLLVPQLIITFVFFYWPATQAVWQSFLLQDAFGLSTSFIWLDNYRALFSDPSYFHTIVTTIIFSGTVAVLSLSIALLLATQADKQLAGAGVYRTLLIWPYAVAPAVAGVLWGFMFQPSLGIVARGLRDYLGIDWNPLLNENHAMILVVLAATWKQISYNFLFFLAGLQAIPRSVTEAAAIEQRGPHRPVGVDTFLCGAVCKGGAALAVKDVPVVVAPTLWCGMAEHHMAFGGTFAFDIPTYQAVLGAFLNSIKRHGFERVFIVNGHGGNIAALNAFLPDLTRESGLLLYATTYFELSKNDL